MDSQDPKHLLAVAAYIAHLDPAKAAEEVGVSPATMRQWIKTKWFQDAVRDYSYADISVTLYKLRTSCPRAVDVLKTAMEGGATRDQVAAAKTVLELTQSLTQFYDLGDRLADLESGLAR